MNDVPLVNKNDINSINTSLIAIKKQLKLLNKAVGLIETPNSPDLTPYVKKSDIVDTVQSGNMNPVTSNAVSESLSYSTDEVKTGGKWTDGNDIYKLTIRTNSTSNITLPFTIGDLIHYNGTFCYGTQKYELNDVYYSSNTYYTLSSRIESSTIQFTKNGFGANISNIIINMMYTKSTTRESNSKGGIEEENNRKSEEEPEEPKEEEKEEEKK